MRESTSRDSSAEIAALAWAAGFRSDPLEGPPLDPCRMTELLVRHRLASRLLRQLKGCSPPGWCTPELQAAMRAQRAAALACQSRQLQALWDVRANVPGRPPLVIKGFTTYALTGDRSTVRYSGDVDLLCSDPEELGRGLEALGYVPSFDYEWRHEYGSFRRDRVALEVHRFYPVYGYPEGIREADLDPDRHPGIWLQSFPSPARHELHFEDLLPYLTPGRTPETRDFLIPCPEAAVLILCAHELKEFLQSPFVLNLPVRLALLAEIHDLIRLPAFDGMLLAELVSRFGGEDAMSLAGRLLGILLGEDPFPGLLGASYRAMGNHPRCLGYRGGWVDLGPPAEALLAPPPMSAIDRLGWCDLLVAPNVTPWSRGPVPPAPGGLDRAIVHAAGGSFDLPALCAWREGAELAVAMRLPPLPGSEHEYRVRLDGPGLGECFSVEIRAGEELPVAAGAGRLELACDSHGYELRIRLPWPSAAVLTEREGAVKVFLTLMRRDRRVRSYYNADAVIALPLRLCA